MTIILSVLAVFLAVAVVLGLVAGVGVWLVSVLWKVALIGLVLWTIVRLVRHFCGND